MTKQKEITLIKSSRIFDSKGDVSIENGALLIEDDQIVQVGSEKDIKVPEGATATEFKYEDATVLPGLVDCHVHLIGIPDGRAGDEVAVESDEVLTLQAARNARIHLYSGVTTIRDCGAKNKTTFMLKEAVKMGITPAPRLIICGRPLAIIGGHLSYFGIEATGVDECIANVRQLMKEGSDFIKITATGGSTRTSYPFLPSFNVDELTAIINETHKFGKHTVAHCASSQGMINALDANIDTIVHGYYKEPDGSYLYKPEISERLVKQNVYVNPTLHQGTETYDALTSKAQIHALTDAEQDKINTFKSNREISIENISRMRQDGVNLVCGSDSAWNHYKMGEFQKEILTHVEVGMSEAEAIRSATIESARSCDVDNIVGTLESGKQADLLVVKGNPVENINDIFNVIDVFQAGSLVDRNNFI